jgi:hypothetical protein
MPGSSKWSLSLRLPTKTLYMPLLSPIRATCPAYLIILDFVTRTILGEEYRSLSSSLCSFFHSPVVHQPINKISASYRRGKYVKYFFFCNEK